MNTLVRKDTRPSTNWLTRFGTAVALSLALIVLFAGTALASGGDFGGGSGDDSSPSNPGSPGGGGGGGGGSNNPPPIIWRYHTSYQSADNLSTISLCAATNSNGDAVLGRRTTFRYPSTVDLGTVYAAIQAGENSSLARDNKVQRVTSGYGCLYPPAPTRSTIKVIVGSTAEVRKVVPDTKVLETTSMTTRWGRGEHTVAAARASTSSRADAYVNIQELGRYEANASTRAVNVTIASYNGARNPVTGASIPDRIVSVSSPYTSHSSSSKGELTCDGWSNSWTGGQKSWSWVDCGPTSTSTPIYQCVPDSGPAVTINGEPGSAILFRSGDPVPVKFGAVRPQGLTDVGAERTRWTRTENSTPWRENGVSVRDANFKLSLQPRGNQLFTNDTSTPWRGGLHTNLYIHGYWSSFSGLPTVVTPSYSYQGTARIKSVRVTGIDSNGQWETATTYRDVRAMAICSGEPLVVEYVRSVQGAG